MTKHQMIFKLKWLHMLRLTTISMPGLPAIFKFSYLCLWTTVAKRSSNYLFTSRKQIVCQRYFIAPVLLVTISTMTANKEHDVREKKPPIRKFFRTNSNSGRTTTHL